MLGITIISRRHWAHHKNIWPLPSSTARSAIVKLHHSRRSLGATKAKTAQNQVKKPANTDIPARLIAGPGRTAEPCPTKTCAIPY